MKTTFYTLKVALILFAMQISCTKKEVQSKDDFEITLSSEWKLLSNDSASTKESLISKVDYIDEKWISTNIPTTVFNTLEQQGDYEDIYFGTNLKQVDKSIFDSPWWFRKTFTINNPNKQVNLKLEGINQYADIWINGTKIADSSEIKNPFRQYSLLINKYIIKGKNVIALKIYPPKKGDYNIGFVDWNPMAPDQEMGITRPIKLAFTNEVAIEQPYIQSNFKNNDYTTVGLDASVLLKNYSEKKTKGILNLEIDGLKISKSIELDPTSEKKVNLNSYEFKELTLNNPKLWWPHTLGTPNLYKATISFTIDNIESDKKEVNFGVREIKDYFTEEGHRGFIINGENILIRGGGWVDNLTLNNTDQNIKAQLDYVKDMNLNTIRLEGFWGNSQKMYDLCDEMGILIMVGWSCHWEWEDYIGKVCDEEYGAITSNEDIDLIANAWKDQIVWLRNHPSIFTWMAGSDKIPTPELEEKYFDIFEEYDSTRVYLSSAKEWASLSGPSGIKMRGPYDVVPPKYWYEDTEYGGAFGFNSETGPGAQIPPLESIKKMIPEENLWPIDSVWEYHCGRNSFNDLSRYNESLFSRYGEMNSVEEYAFKAQAMNYELMRAMFESFSVNKPKATGIIQWMLNSAWPEFYWQLYDYYLMPNGAYYGAKKANNLIHGMYNYVENSIYLSNEKQKNIEDLEVIVNIIDINSKVLFSKKIITNSKSNSSSKILDLPNIKTEGTYFLSIKINDKNQRQIDDNFYWLSTKNDLLNYNASTWVYTPQKQFADLTDLNNLKPVTVSQNFSKTTEGDYTVFTINLENKSEETLAFLVNPKLVDKKTGEQILPVLWSDNYISLLPTEKRRLVAKINNEYTSNKEIDLLVDLWNKK